MPQTRFRESGGLTPKGLLKSAAASRMMIFRTKKQKKEMPDISYFQEITRKAVHLSSLWMPALILFASAPVPAAVFAGMLAVNVLIEYGYYKKWNIVLKIYGPLFGKMLRSQKNDGKFRLSGAPFVLTAAFYSCLLFTPINAAAAMTVMLIADTAAALIGRRIGKHKINHNTKSIEGSVAFLISGWAVIGIFAALFQPAGGFILRGTIGVFFAMWAELYEDRLKIDDNLSIPLIVGACLTV